MRAFLRGFVYAGRGFWHALKEERNLRFHLCVAVYVYLFSAFYSFGAVQYTLLTVLVGGVVALELANSAIERAVDLASTRTPLAAAAKDMAAAAVLAFCVAAAVCGVLLFWDVAVFKQIFAFFAAHLALLALFVLSLVLCGWFVFGLWRKNQKEK